MIKTSFIHAARKKMVDEGDLNEKDKVRRILRDNFDITVLEDMVLFFSKTNGYRYKNPPKSLTKEQIFQHFHVIRPDLWSPTEILAVEIDGAVHWQRTGGFFNDTATTEIYTRGKVKLLWLTKDEVGKNTDAELAEKISGLLGTGII